MTSGQPNTSQTGKPLSARRPSFAPMCPKDASRFLEASQLRRQINLHLRACDCACHFLPFLVEACIVATRDDAKLGAPRRRIGKRWVLAIFPRYRAATRPEQFLRSCCALLQSTPDGVRCQLCIQGCDPRSLTTQGEATWQTQTNPSHECRITIPSLDRSGETRPPKALSTPLRSSGVTKTSPGNTRPLRTSTQVICFYFLELRWFAIRRFAICARPIVSPSRPKKKTRRNLRNSGQGARKGVLPFFMLAVFQSRQVCETDPTRLALHRWRACCPRFRPTRMRGLQRLGSGARTGYNRIDYGHACAAFRNRSRRPLSQRPIQLNGVAPDTALFPLLPGLGESPRSFPSRIEFGASRRGINPQPERKNSFAALGSLRFICPMIRTIRGGSKLCACDTRHASGNFLSEISSAQLGKGRASARPRCIPSCMPEAATETVPVSVPFGFVRVVASRAWEVHP